MHTFEQNRRIFHLSPSGTLMGKIIESLPGTDVSIAKLNPGLRYVNKTFGNNTDSQGTSITGLSPATMLLNNRLCTTVKDSKEIEKDVKRLTGGKLVADGIK